MHDPRPIVAVNGHGADVSDTPDAGGVRRLHQPPDRRDVDPVLDGRRATQCRANVEDHGAAGHRAPQGLRVGQVAHA